MIDLGSVKNEWLLLIKYERINILFQKILKYFVYEKTFFNRRS